MYFKLQTPKLFQMTQIQSSEEQDRMKAATFFITKTITVSNTLTLMNTESD
jgi:hypothetical protein